MVTVNAMGDNCPIPVIKTKKAMQALTGPETIEVLVDNEIAVQNVTKLAKEQGGEVSSEKLGEKEYKVTGSRCRSCMYTGSEGRPYRSGIFRPHGNR